MGLFTTKTKRTYHRTQPKRGWSTTSKASTRAKRWARRKTKALWRTTKQRIRNRWRRSQRQRATRNRQHNRQVARSRPVHPTSSYQSDSGTLEGQVKLPPPDGAVATCRRCSNEVQYSEGHGRWEHTGHGHWECFQPHRT